MLQKIKKQNRGFSLLELLLAIAIFSLSAISIGYLLIESARATELNTKKIQATLLAREGIEAVRSIRDVDGFSALTIGSHGLAFNNITNTWSFSGTSDTSTDGYVRVITLTDESPRIKVSSVVSIDVLGRTISTSLITYFTDWR